MLLKRNLLETLTIISCSGTIICLLLNYVTNISPITGIWLISYLLLLFILSVCGSFKFIQWLLHLNKPLKYDIEIILNKYPFLSYLSDILPQIQKKVENEHIKEYDTNELSVITSVLEKKLVSSWYMSYISQEIGFPFACKQILDQMIAKTFQICNKVETKDVYVDVCAIFITHLKEYKKALKRHESIPDSSIEILYKKVHPVFNSKNKRPVTADHCTNVLRIILKELVPWELWDTPFSELLIRILAKKLDNLIDNTISDPVWLNDRLLSLLKAENKIPEEKPVNEPSNEVKEAETIKQDPPEAQTKSSPKIAKKNIPPVIQNNINEEHKEDDKPEIEKAVEGCEMLEIKPAAILRQRRGRQGRNEVKIYDRIIEGSVKTWDTDMDLQCISVGQDLLASLDEMTLSRLWGHEEAEQSPKMRDASPQPLWFGEEDTIESDPENNKDSKKETSPKPTEALLKDLQSTVHHAKTKIGDLQVPLYIDVPRKHSSDEAAGMMEGLLDKGIAGIKKGLRFTGLSDDSQEKSPAHKDRNSEKISPSELHRSRQKPEVVMEVKESYMPFGNQKEENGTTSHALVKQQRVTSQDSMHSTAAPPSVSYGPWGRRVEGGAPESLSESPEPQYEEAADLSASIAKLRTLLQHAGPREEAWWESSEQTRTRHHVDSAALADEYDMNLDRGSSPGQTTNNMQRLDKLFQRTVTGVFNSIKTAVGAEGEELPPRQLHDWTYVCTSPELSVSACASRLWAARRALWHVDGALDPLRALGPPAAPLAAPLDLGTDTVLHCTRSTSVRTLLHCTRSTSVRTLYSTVPARPRYGHCTPLYPLDLGTDTTPLYPLDLGTDTTPLYPLDLGTDTVLHCTRSTSVRTLYSTVPARPRYGHCTPLYPLDLGTDTVLHCTRSTSVRTLLHCTRSTSVRTLYSTVPARPRYGHCTPLYPLDLGTDTTPLYPLDLGTDTVLHCTRSTSVRTLYSTVPARPRYGHCTPLYPLDLGTDTVLHCTRATSSG
ncbi:uncharacterized protein LOC126776714 isoform X10 [Nymphalis io]|uniref:uncharacterized protein LOC126776714 isoform X10 n=1 Tax=Inachis io TaxID=171585 RepID=UPI002168900E|nr:uncharacterized protein LOC126776714 isoform X10 [Nymphalis io]